MSGTWISAAAGSAAGVAWFLDSLVTTSPATPTVRALLSGTESDECSPHAESDPGALDPSADVLIARTSPRVGLGSESLIGASWTGLSWQNFGWSL
jgi:hypothetical protein